METNALNAKKILKSHLFNLETFIHFYKKKIFEERHRPGGAGDRK
jgi:hypothetical protein